VKASRNQSNAPAASPHSRVKKLTDIGRRFGWKQTFMTAALWTFRQLVGYRAAIIYRLDLNEVQPAAGCQRFQWSYKPAGEITPELWCAADIQGAEQVAPPGVRCFVAMLKHEQCYLSLVSGQGFSVPGRISVAFASEAEAYVGNCITLDPYRGLGVYPCGLTELGLRLQKEGCRWLYLFVERENLSSVRGVEKAGFLPVAACSVFRWRGRNRQRFEVFPRIKDAEAVYRWAISTS
jgi:hypothetical protein